MPRPSSYWPPPSRWFPYKPSHALYTFEPLLALVNTKVTADNYAQLVFGGGMHSQRDSLRLMNVQNSSLGGQPPALGSGRLRSNDRKSARQRTDQATFVLSWNGAAPHFQKLGFTNPDPNSLILFREGSLPPARCDRVSMGAVVQLRSALLRGLQRYLLDAEDPLIDPATAKLDFVIGARLPCADARGYIDNRGRDVVLSDNLQDYWYRMFRLLIVKLREGQPLTHRESRRRYRLPFQPLKRCEVTFGKVSKDGPLIKSDEPTGCGRFYFPSVAGQRTCGRPRCLDRDRYLRTRAR